MAVQIKAVLECMFIRNFSAPTMYSIDYYNREWILGDKSYMFGRK